MLRHSTAYHRLHWLLRSEIKQFRYPARAYDSHPKMDRRSMGSFQRIHSTDFHGHASCFVSNYSYFDNNIDFFHSSGLLTRLFRFPQVIHQHYHPSYSRLDCIRILDCRRSKKGLWSLMTKQHRQHLIAQGVPRAHNITVITRWWMIVLDGSWGAVRCCIAQCLGYLFRVLSKFDTPHKRASRVAIEMIYLPLLDLMKQRVRETGCNHSLDNFNLLFLYDTRAKFHLVIPLTLWKKSMRKWVSENDHNDKCVTLDTNNDLHNLLTIFRPYRREIKHYYALYFVE